MNPEILRARSIFLQDIRRFFDQRGFIEVDPPLLYPGVATDPGLSAFCVDGRYLQTSPEFAMKRLLAEGSGPIYYLGKAFRKEESGAHHHPEFTILEWYRPDWDHWRLIEEVQSLFRVLLDTRPALRTTYAALFEQYVGINPHEGSVEALRAIAVAKGWAQETDAGDKDYFLSLLMTHAIEPYIGQSAPCIVTDYPGSQASLARTREIMGTDNTPIAVAERFEFYYRGLELANGYHELLCPDILAQRFETDLAKRQALGLPWLPKDEALLAAMRKGLPPCAGVAVGVDRLFMIQQHAQHIREVIVFPV